MCELHASCPNCNQPDLDADEERCITLDGLTIRAYQCHVCGARIGVSVDTKARPLAVDAIQVS
jgi:hypothetical protein